MDALIFDSELSTSRIWYITITSIMVTIEGELKVISLIGIF